MQPAASPLPALIGVIHLPPLPHSPRFVVGQGGGPDGGGLDALVESAARDAATLAAAGYQGVMVENFGDAPFAPGAVDPVTVACMTRCALAVRRAAPGLVLGINVLRNDAHSALGIAVGCGAGMVRVNVHSGARVTDQGIIEGRAYETARRRAVLAPGCRLLCDVAVKHSAALTPREVVEEAVETAERGLADALLITGWGTGHAPPAERIARVVEAVEVPVYVASGATAETVVQLDAAYGVIVGSALRADGRPGGPIDAAAAQRFADAWRQHRG